MRALSACEMIKKALKKAKNDILHMRLVHIDEINSRKIILRVDDIDDDLIKISFCELCISAKITRNLSTKLISEVTTKLGRVYMDF